MNAIASPTRIAERVDAINWTHVSRALDTQGSAIVERLLSPKACETLAGLYSHDDLFRSRVVMGRHGFGRGEYKYFTYPLPDIIAELRTVFYPYLVPIANRWNTAMGIHVRYPDTHADFIERCHRPGRSNRHRSCFSMERTITTVCIKTCTASMCFRSNSLFCYRNPTKTSRGANLS